MKFQELKELPNFMLGFIFGLAIVHAKQAADELYPFASEEERNAHIDRFTNILLSDYALSYEKPDKENAV